MTRNIRSLVALLIGALSSACDNGPDAPLPAAGHTRPAHLVKVAPATRQLASLNITRTGTIKARRSVRIFSQEEGTITALPWFEGDRVKSGELLVRLDDSLLQAEIAKALAMRKQAELNLKRQEELGERNLTSQDERARARTAVEVARAEETLLRRRIAHTRINAPFAGVVSARLVEPGDAVPRHTHLLSLTDPDSLIAEVALPARVLTGLQPGDTAEVRIDALGSHEIAGHILRLHPTVNADTRRGIAEITLTDSPTGLAAGQLCRVTVHSQPVERLLVPFQALQRDREQEFVYRIIDDKAGKAPVKSGIRYGEQVEIVSGIEAGDRVVTHGFLGLRDQLTIEIVDSGDGQAGN